jgi:hypothetical protein
MSHMGWGGLGASRYSQRLCVSLRARPPSVSGVAPLSLRSRSPFPPAVTQAMPASFGITGPASQGRRRGRGEARHESRHESRQSIKERRAVVASANQPTDRPADHERGDEKINLTRRSK